jgi:hypothetical protein
MFRKVGYKQKISESWNPRLVTDSWTACYNRRLWRVVVGDTMHDLLYYVSPYPNEDIWTLTAWVGSFISGLTLRNNRKGPVNTVCPPLPVSLYTCRPMLGVQFIRRLKSDLCTTVTRLRATEKKISNSHAQNTTAFKSKEFLTRLYQLLVIKI